MARAIVSGLCATGFSSRNICVVDHNIEKRDFFSHTLKTEVSENAQAFLLHADVIVLAVKPQGAKAVCESLKEGLKQHAPLILSVMAGITLETLATWMGAHLPMIRAVPNTPAKIQLGATGLFANPKVSHDHQVLIEKMMASIGIFAWLPEESQLNTITALSGSGPAYYFYLIETMESIAIKLGIPPKIARDFSIQTAYGASKLALESMDDLATLRAQVTSKKGTTEAALEVMQEAGLAHILEDALKAAAARSLELCKIASE